MSSSSLSSREDASDKAAFEMVCGACHPTSLVNALRSAAEWDQTVDLMASLGAKGTDEQFDRVMRFLLRNLTQVNVNTATAPELALVLDVSNAAASAVVKYRGQNGKFKALEELKRVPGLNAAKRDARRDRIRV